jgi:hypothetical protein
VEVGETCETDEVDRLSGPLACSNQLGGDGGTFHKLVAVVTSSNPDFFHRSQDCVYTSYFGLYSMKSSSPEKRLDACLILRAADFCPASESLFPEDRISKTDS